MATNIQIYTSFIRVINAAIDTGGFQDISPAEVEFHAEKGDLITFLKSKYNNKIDWSYFEDESKPEASQVLKDMQIAAATYNGGGGKWGIANSGLCLLIAWSTLAIEGGFE